jgi:hypothetical protein
MTIEAERSVAMLWCARLTWALLPVSAGIALTDALDGWDTGPARVAAVLLWAAWAVGLIALLAPRPWGLTALRVVAPAAVVVALASIAGAGGGAAALAVSTCVVAAVFALSAPIAQAAGNALAYGDEVRFPLRIPPALFLGPVPLAVLLIGAGVSVGPLLIANENYVAGVVLTIVGVAVAAVLARSLHALSLRWLVLVPAGVVIVDPIALADPVLMRREVIDHVERSPHAPPGPDALDLRLGSLAGTIAISLHTPQSFARRRGRHDAKLHEVSDALVSTVRSDAFVREAGARRIAVS